MNNQDFCYWLQGFFEIQKPKVINSIQLQEIKNHLDLILKDKNNPSLSLTTSNIQYCEQIFPTLDCFSEAPAC